MQIRIVPAGSWAEGDFPIHGLDRDVITMKRHFVVLLIFVIFTVFLTAVSAQDIDNMDKEQLEALLQAITQKLQEYETNPEKEQSSDKEVQEFSATSPSPTPETKTVKFQIYDNKKLIIDRLPDSMFIRKETGGGEEEKEDNSDSRTLEEIHHCPPGATYECYTDIFTGEYICSCGYG